MAANLFEMQTSMESDTIEMQTSMESDTIEVRIRLPKSAVENLRLDDFDKAEVQDCLKGGQPAHVVLVALEIIFRRMHEETVEAGSTPETVRYPPVRGEDQVRSWIESIPMWRSAVEPVGRVTIPQPQPVPVPTQARFSSMTQEQGRRWRDVQYNQLVRQNDMDEWLLRQRPPPTTR